MCLKAQEDVHAFKQNEDLTWNRLHIQAYNMQAIRINAWLDFSQIPCENDELTSQQNHGAIRMSP